MLLTSENPGRLDVFLSENASVTRTRAAKLIKDGLVKVNGETASKAGLQLKSGDAVDFEIPEAVPSVISPENIPLRIVYEDD
jgi:23S rRNA pseudouridine1911/1915/1917 synthase